MNPIEKVEVRKKCSKKANSEEKTIKLAKTGKTVPWFKVPFPEDPRFLMSSDIAVDKS